MIEIDPGLVLRRDQDCVESNGDVVFVHDAHLGLPVGAKVRELASSANLREALRKSVRGPYRKGHQVRRLVARVAEHHPLVARTLGIRLVLAAATCPHLGSEIHPLGDVGRLLVERDHHPACDPRKALVVVVVPDVADGLPVRVLATST